MTVTDPLTPNCAASLGTLAAGASAPAYNCTLGNVTSSFTNVATVVGTPPTGANVSAQDTAPVTVASTPPPSNPSITITKNPKSQTIASGGTASFTIVVTNNGNVTLTNVTVTDPLTPNCAANLGTLAAGASAPAYTCTLTGVTTGFTNVATATGTPPSGSNVTAQDTAPVTVTPPPVVQVLTPPSNPAIAIVKSPKSQTLSVGGTASFTIKVTNTGDVTLTDVTVTDPLSTGCDHSLGTLAVGQSKSYDCSKPGVTAGFENVATATGKPTTSASTVKATDHANVKVAAALKPPQRAVIAIVKSPKLQTLTTKIVKKTDKTGKPTTTVAYGTANFTIKVTNGGNVRLTAVRVGDPLSPACNRNLGTLNAGASRSFTCSRANVGAGYTNIATASGKPPTGPRVSAHDHAVVVVKVATQSISSAQFTG